MEENKTNSKKNAIIGLVAVVAIILVVVLLVKLVGPSPAKTVKKYCKLMNKGEVAKAFELVDLESMYVLMGMDEDEYEDYAEELKDFKDDEDEYEEYEEGVEDFEETIEELEDEFSDLDEYKLEVKEIKDTKKEGKNIWKVKAKVKFVMESEYDEIDKTETVEFYVVKKGLKYYIAAGDGFMGSMGGMYY